MRILKRPGLFVGAVANDDGGIEIYNFLKNYYHQFTQKINIYPCRLDGLVRYGILKEKNKNYMIIRCEKCKKTSLISGI